MDVNNFNENELKLIVHCIQVTLDWSLKNPDPQFYVTLDSITKKCEQAIPKPAIDARKSTSRKTLRTKSHITTNLGDVIAKLNIPN